MEYTSRKPTIAEFCEKEKKKRRNVYRLYAENPGLKCQIPGEKESRVDLDKWDKILKTA